jgi:hypothetical protein
MIIFFSENMDISRKKMIRIASLFCLSFILFSCSEGEIPIPPACELIPTQALGQILREPVEKPTPTNASLGEISACTFSLPGRSLDDYLGIYVFPAAPTRDMLSLKAVADQWKTQNAGADYQILDNANYPMAFYPGEHKVYPSTFIILFTRATLVITGVSKEDAQTIAFRSMVQYKMDS